MDWITFIKWNGIVYATYYGANLLVDYLRTRGEISHHSGSIQYNLKDLGIEKPQVVHRSDFSPRNEKQSAIKEEKVRDEKAAQSNQISFGAPIERQGIPLNEFIRIATQSGKEIFQPTIYT
jgi:Fe-S cluster assembly ATPase SufC